MIFIIHTDWLTIWYVVLLVQARMALRENFKRSCAENFFRVLRCQIFYFIDEHGWVKDCVLFGGLKNIFNNTKRKDLSPFYGAY